MAEAPARTHRGLTWQDMPGRLHIQQRLTFALFCRSQWPPPSWRVPAALEGRALVLLLEERRAAFRPGKRKD